MPGNGNETPPGTPRVTPPGTPEVTRPPSQPPAIPRPLRMSELHVVFMNVLRHAYNAIGQVVDVNSPVTIYSLPVEVIRDIFRHPNCRFPDRFRRLNRNGAAHALEFAVPKF